MAAGLLRTELDRKAKGLAASPDPRRCLVDDLLEALEARYTTEGWRSVDRLRFSTEHLLRLFKGVQAMRVTGADVLRYAQLRLKENAAAATVNRELAALRAAYRLGLDNDVIVAMPRIRLLPENNARKGFADAGQVEAICRSLQPAVADAVRFMFITGWRSRSEVLRLAWGQVDLSGGFVRLEPGTTKNNEGRNFPLIPELRRLLERRQEHTRRCERAQGRIIPEVFHRYGRPIRLMRRASRRKRPRSESSRILSRAECELRLTTTGGVSASRIRGEVFARIVARTRLNMPLQRSRITLGLT